MMIRFVLLLGVLHWSCCWSFLIKPPRAESGRIGSEQPLCMGEQVALPLYAGRRGDRCAATSLRLRHFAAAGSDGGATATLDLADPLGLLDGMRNPEIADSYSTSMDLGRAAQMVSERGIIYKAAKRDAEEMGEDLQVYLKEVKWKAKSFIDSDEIVNREELKEALDAIMEDTGHFVCLLGGKSTGKSLLLQNLAARHKGKVFLVKLRRHGTILSGLIRVLAQTISLEKWATIVADILGLGKDVSTPLPAMLKAIQDNINLKVESVEAGLAMMGNAEPGFAAIEKASRGLVGLLRDIQSRGDGKGEPLSIVVDAMIKKLGPVTIVVDEANIAFNVTPTTKDGNIEETNAALAFFTLFSKEERKGNVILVSSEHAFPFGLTRRPIGFKLENLSRLLYASEAPPKDMLHVLPERWGAGPHLAHALVAHYGGHVWETYLALCKLCEGEKQAYKVGLDPSKSSCVQACLAWRPEGEADIKQQQDRMKQVLELLATQGFAPIETRDDEIAEVISQYNVGGVVQLDALVAGLPVEIWGDAEYGLVPATQAMRLAVAKHLVRVKAEEPKKTGE